MSNLDELVGARQRAHIHAPLQCPSDHLDLAAPADGMVMWIVRHDDAPHGGRMSHRGRIWAASRVATL